jgi:ubiquinone/menaquinone biosynthesis C-methylase UbiE
MTRLFPLLIAVSLLARPAVAVAQAPADAHEMHRLHTDVAAYIAALEEPDRDAWQKPHEVMQALAVRPGATVADIGAGSGYFTLRLAHHVGPTGRVYAVDVNPGMIRHLDERIRDAGLSHVTTILAPPDDPRLPEPVDLVLIVDVWHHIEDPDVYLEKLKTSLKPGGRIVMIDFHKDELPVGPPVEMKIARNELVAWMEQRGLVLAREHTFLPYQYFLEFTVR